MRWLALLLSLGMLGCLGASEKHEELRGLINAAIDSIEGHKKKTADHIAQHLDGVREHRLAQGPGIDRRKLALELDFLRLRSYLVYLGFDSDEYRAQHRHIMNEYFPDFSNHYFYVQAASSLVPWQSKSDDQVDVKYLTNKIYEDGIIVPDYVTMLAVANDPRLLLQQALMFGVMAQTRGDEQKTLELADQIVREVKDPFATRAVREYLDFVGVPAKDLEMDAVGPSDDSALPSEADTGGAGDEFQHQDLEIVYFDDYLAEQAEEARVKKEEEEMASRNERRIKYIGILIMFLGVIIVASSFLRSRRAC